MIDPEVRSQVLSLVGNAMAGIMMRITRSYRPGDFIAVEEVEGRVINQGLFHTEIQQITRDVVALPNLYLSRLPVQIVRDKGMMAGPPAGSLAPHAPGRT